MFIFVDPDQQTLDLREKDDLKSLAIRVVSSRGAEASAESLGTVLAPLGRLDSETHAWVSIERLREACACDDDRWLQQFNAMVTYATSKGWTDTAKQCLRVHIDYGVPVSDH